MIVRIACGIWVAQVSVTRAVAVSHAACAARGSSGSAFCRCLHATFDSDIFRRFRVDERRARRERRIGADDRRRLFDLDLDGVGNVLRLIPA